MKKIILPLLLTMLMYGGCAAEMQITEQESTTAEPSVSSSEASPTETEPVSTEPLRIYHITSLADAEQLSEDDLIYMAQHSDAIIYADTETIDLFGMELLAEWDNKYPVYENVSTIICQTETLAKDIDVLKCISSKEIRQFADEKHQSMTYTGTKSYDEPNSFSEDEEFLLCGENDWYIEYSIRFTDVRTLYENNILVTHRIPRAYRHVYMKTMIETTGEDNWMRLLLGELDAAYVQQQLDLLVSTQRSNILYREVTESESEYTYRYLYYYVSFGDYGVNDEVYLALGTWTVDKQTHEMQNLSSTTVKSAEIEGSSRFEDEEG